MKIISDMYNKKIISTDGRILGTITGVSVMKDWTVNGLTVRIEREVLGDLGKRGPFFGTLSLDVGVENVIAIDDNVLLNKTLKEMGGLLTDYQKNNDSSYLLRMRIVDSDGKKIGMVQDINIDDKNWKVPSLVMCMNKEMSDNMMVKNPGFSNPEVNLSIRQISGTDDKVMLSVTSDQLGNILEETSGK